MTVTSCAGKHMTSQTWRLKRLFLDDSFAFNTRYEHFYNIKRLYFGYLSEILWYMRNFFLLPMSFKQNIEM